MEFNSLTKTQFETICYNKNPCVIRQGGKDWNLFKKWSLEYLHERIGDSPVSLCHSKKSYYNFNDTSANGVVFVPMIFSDAAAIICDDTSSGEFYLQQTPIHKYFPELLDDLDQPSWIEKKFLNVVNLWFGSDGCVSPLHFDLVQNFLIQISGTKKFTLISPQYSDKLYANKEAKFPNISRVDLRNVDYDKYPLLVEVDMLEITIEPGDILYLPAFWWHQVSSAGTNMAVNYWWEYDEALDESSFAKDDDAENSLQGWWKSSVANSGIVTEKPKNSQKFKGLKKLK